MPCFDFAQRYEEGSRNKISRKILGGKYKGFEVLDLYFLLRRSNMLVGHKEGTRIKKEE